MSDTKDKITAAKLMLLIALDEKREEGEWNTEDSEISTLLSSDPEVQQLEKKIDNEQ